MMKLIATKLPTVARILLGLVFFVFGLNGFLGFLPTPPLPEQAGAFFGAMIATGYLFPLIKTVEVVAGLLLLANRFVPLSLVLLAPITVNILAFHMFLTPGDVGMSIVLVLAQAFLGWSYRDSYRGLLAAKAAPAPARETSPAAATASPAQA